jgi:hypothetical protein
MRGALPNEAANAYKQSILFLMIPVQSFKIVASSWPRVQQAPQLSLGHCYIATSKAHQKFTHIQCGLTWIRVAEMDGYFYI